MLSNPSARTALDPIELAALVTNVTQPMCGLTFAPADPGERNGLELRRAAVLPIAGQHPMRVTLSSDERSCSTLASVLYGCPPEELSSQMIDDLVCELANMTAGQVKAALAFDQCLGLPHMVPVDGAPGQELALPPGGILLRSQGPIHLIIWITEDGSPQ